MRQALTPEEARNFYERFGSLQDTRCFYENPATATLLSWLNLNKKGYILLLHNREWQMHEL
ncbi:MAG TPA: hypothetical protein VH186_20555 [Chloroflexia bacterium]|nr:hypothetical protein [Chloroflexia bacterium]